MHVVGNIDTVQAFCLCTHAQGPCGDHLPLLTGFSVVLCPGGALGEEVLMELLDLIAAGETRPEDIRPKK